MNDADFLAALRTVVGERAVLTGDGLERYRRDWANLPGGDPLAVVRPASTEEVSRVLALANVEGRTVVPQGGLSGLAGGANPADGDLVLSLERMNRIEQIDIASGTVTAQAGVILQTLQEACAAEGALLGLDLGARGSCQVGGNLATNAGGNRVIRYGMARDLVLGVEAVLADGTVLEMLSRVVKNNTGVDLKQLFIGSEGTLGVITRVVLKLHPMPQATATALVALQDYASAVRFLRHAQASLSGQVSAFEIMWDDYMQITTAACNITPPLAERYPLYVLIDLHCGQPETDAARFEAMLEAAFEQGLLLDGVVAQSVAEAESFWNIRDGIADVLRDIAPTLNFDVSVPVSQIGDCAERIRANLSAGWPDMKALFFGHVGDGNLHVVVCKVPADHDSLMRIEEAVYSVVRTHGGSISAEHGIGTLKRDWLHYSRSEAELATMQALKHALDPKGILNPGKLFQTS